MHLPLCITKRVVKELRNVITGKLVNQNSLRNHNPTNNMML